jgi:hypothetical protein
MNLINEKMVPKSVEIMSKKLDKELYNEMVHSHGKFRKNSHFPKAKKPAAAGADPAAAGADPAAPADPAAAPPADAAAAPPADPAAAPPAADAAAAPPAAGAAPAGGPPPGVDAFYFRVSGHNIYYTETATDAVVLGAISMRNIEKVHASALIEKKCFKITNSEKVEWDLCVLDAEPDCSKWVCAIEEAIGGPPCPAGGPPGAEGGDGAAPADGGAPADAAKDDKAKEKEIIE